MTSKIFVLGLMGTLALACGSSDDSSSGTQGATPNKQVAGQTTQTAIGGFQTALKPGASNGQTSVSQLQGAASSSQNLATPTSSASQGLSIESLLAPLDNNAGGEGCTCTENSCTFKACKIGLVQIDGTYSFDAGHIKGDVTYIVNTGQANATIKFDCDVTATATSLDGNFHAVGDVSTQYGGTTYGNHWDATITFDKIVYPSGGGAPTGGSEHVKSTTTVTGSQPQAYSADFDVTFPQ